MERDKTLKERYCDYCNHRIPLVKRNKVGVKCIVCNKDVCYRCGYDITHTDYPDTYVFKVKRIGRICKDCFSKKINTSKLEYLIKD